MTTRPGYTATLTDTATGERLARFAYAEDAHTAARALAAYTGHTMRVTTRDGDAHHTPEGTQL